MRTIPIFYSAIYCAVLFSVFGAAEAENCQRGSELRAEGAKLPIGSQEQEERFREGIRECASLAELHYDLGVNLLNQSRMDEATASFREAVKLESDANFYYALGSALVRQGQPSAAGDEFRKMNDRFPKDIRAHLGLAMVSADQGDLTKAEEWIRQSVQLEPRNAKLYYNLGAILERQTKYDEALTSYEASIDKDPDQPEVLERLGALRMRGGKLELAERNLERATVLNGRSPRAWILLAQVRSLRGKKAEAFQAIERASQLTPDDPSVLRARGVLLTENGDATGAETLLRGAVGRFPRDAELRAALGYMLLRVKKTAEARQELETALSIDPGNYSAHHNLGVIFEDSGDSERAARHFELASPGRAAR